MATSANPRSSRALRNTTKTKTSKEPLWDPTFEPFMIELLTGKGVKIRGAVEVGTKAVEYFRGQDFVKWVLKQQDSLVHKFPDCFPTSTGPLSTDDAVSVGDQLLHRGFIYRAEHKPLAGGLNSAKEGPGSSSERKTFMALSWDNVTWSASIPKWPTRLGYSPVQKFDPASFFVIMYEPASSWHYIMLTLIVGAVLAVCMFPAWPLYLKLAVWYILVCLMTVLLVIIVLRLVTFVAVWFCGADFWIFPNLFAEDYRRDGWIMIAARVFLAILTAGSLYQLSQTHSLADVHRFATQQFLDVVDWGHQKLAAPPAEASVPVAKFSDGSVPNTPEPDPFACMQPCGFKSFEEIKEECIFDCQCMIALVESHCFKKCPEASKSTLTDAQHDACRAEAEDDDDDEADATTTTTSQKRSDL